MTKGDSGLKIVFEALRPSRREKIKLVAKHITQHRELMRTEVRLEEIRAASDAREKELDHFARAEESAIRQEYSTLHTHVAPKPYDKELDRNHAAVCKGTGKWLFRDQSFTDWANYSKGSAQILWLRGIPGAGKSRA